MASCVGASGRQIAAARAIAWFSTVKDSITSGPPYPVSRSADAIRRHVIWSDPGAPRSQPQAWKWARCPLHNRRSEEHTSELQSQSNLVCRLLLEKKKKKKKKEILRRKQLHERVTLNIMTQI